MHINRIMVLLVGESLRHCLQLVRWLDKRGCHCEFAGSYRDACTMLSQIQFELVLSEYQLPDRTAFPLLDCLLGTPATLFFCVWVEEGVLWLKMLERGERCVGALVLRQKDLISALDQVLTKTAPADRPADISRPGTSVMFSGK